MKKTFILVILLLCAISLYAQKIEKIDDVNIKVTGDRYIATFNDYNGGYLQSFIVDGEEFEEQKIDKTRGNYLLGNDGVGKIEKRQWDGNKYTLTTNYGTMSYTFYPDKIEISSNGNNWAGCYFILNPLVKNCKVNNEFKKVPIEREPCNGYIWARNRAAIKTEGDIICWGPWINTQVIDFSIEANKTKTLTISPVTLLPEDIEYILDSPEKKDFVLYSPQNLQVFQRYSKEKGKIALNGKLSKNVTSLSYKISGKDLNNKPVDTKWISVKINKYNNFNTFIDFNAGGWYKLELKYNVGKEEKTFTLDKVGIGEIIIGAGQSNSTNFGQTPVKLETDYVVNTDGVNWRVANDPQIGVHDGSTGGSLYPALGDALYREFNVPIAVAPTGWGGTTLAQWQPDADPCGASSIKANINLYDFFMNRVYQFGKEGFRCVLWHQGESDFGQTSEYYYDKLSNIIWSSRKDAGWQIPWFTAKATYIPGMGLSQNVRTGQADLWRNNVSYEGPDTDQWLEEYRDQDGKGIHFAPNGLKKHGEAWAEFIGKYIHNMID